MLASPQLTCSGSSEEASSPSSPSSSSSSSYSSVLSLSAPSGGLASPPLMVGGHEHVPLTSVPTLASALLGRNRAPFREQHEEDEGRAIMTQQHIHAVLASLAQKFEASGAVGAGWRSPPPTRRHRRSGSQMEGPSSSSSSSSPSASFGSSSSSPTAFSSADASEQPSRKRRRTARTKSASAASDIHHQGRQADGDHQLHQQGQEEGTKRRRRSSKKESKVTGQSSVPDCGAGSSDGVLEGQASTTRRKKGRRERKAATLTQLLQQHQGQHQGQDERREHEAGAPGMHQGAMVEEQQQRSRPTASIAFLLNDEDSFDSVTFEFGGFAFEVAPQPSPTPARPASLGSSSGSPPPTPPPSYPFPCHVMERRAAYAAH